VADERCVRPPDEKVVGKEMWGLYSWNGPSVREGFAEPGDHCARKEKGAGRPPKKVVMMRALGSLTGRDRPRENRGRCQQLERPAYAEGCRKKAQDRRGIIYSFD